MAPDFGTEVNGGKDSSSIHPDIVEDISMEGSNEGEWVIVKVGDAGDVAEEVALDEFLL